MENADPESLDWARLGQEILAQRNKLGLSQEDIAGAGGPSHATLRRIERGEPGPYQSRTLERLEDALEWKVGVIDAILHGRAGDNKNAWLTDSARLRETMQTIAGGAGRALRGVFHPPTNGQQLTDTAAADDTAHAHVTAHPVTASAQVGNPTVTTTPSAAQHLKEVVAAARIVFNLASTPATDAAKRAMTEAVHEAMQAAPGGH